MLDLSKVSLIAPEGGQVFGRCDSAEEHVVAEASGLGDEGRAAEVGSEVGELAWFADAARHDGAPNAGVLEDTDDLSELADADPGQVRDEVRDLVGRLVLVRHCHDFDAGAVRCFREEQREAAVAGDQADALRRRHRRRLRRLRLCRPRTRRVSTRR